MRLLLLLLQYTKFFPLDNFFKLLSKEELDEYVTYSKSNFDFIKEKNKIIAFNVKQFFVLNVAVIIYITIGLILTIFLYQIVE